MSEIITATLDRVGYSKDMILFTVIDAYPDSTINNKFLNTKNIDGLNDHLRYLHKAGDRVQFKVTEFGEIKDFKNITLSEMK